MSCVALINVHIESLMSVNRLFSGSTWPSWPKRTKGLDPLIEINIRPTHLDPIVPSFSAKKNIHIWQSRFYAFLLLIVKLLRCVMFIFCRGKMEHQELLVSPSRWNMTKKSFSQKPERGGRNYCLSVVSPGLHPQCSAFLTQSDIHLYFCTLCLNRWV